MPPKDPRPLDLDAILADPVALARTTRALRRVALSVVGEHAASEDVVQGAWLELLQRGGGRVGHGWLRALVRSRSIDAVRRRGRERTTFPSGGAEPDERLGRDLGLQRAVLEAVDALDEPYRGTVYLRYFEGLGPTAIARRTGTPVRTVETRLTRAHGLLRERLRATHRGDDGSWSPALLAFAGGSSSLDVVGTTSLLSVLMMKKLAFVASVALALFLGWIALKEVRGDGAERALPSDGVASPREPSELADPGGARVDVRTSFQPERTERVDPIESEPASVGPTTAALRVSVLRADGSPAPNVHVVATTATDVSTLRRRARRRTGVDGVAFFPRLEPGGVVVRTDRGESPWSTVELAAGATSELAVTLPTGLRVTGTVRDLERRPVADARIWLSSPTGGWTSGGVVAHADAAGRFEVLDVPEGRSLGAFASGHLPSQLFDLDLLERDADPVVVDLVVERGGARLEGTVRDEGGHPLADVVLAVGDHSEVLELRPDGTERESWGARATRSDATGRFSFDSLEPGEHVLRTRADAFPGWLGRVRVASGATARIDVVLRPGARVVGRVTDATGEPVGGALVHAFPERLRETYLQGGQVDHDSPFRHAVVVADEDGRFELAGVAPGEVHLYAREPVDDARSLGEVRRYVRRVATLAPDETLDWDPVLTDGRVVEGIAVHSDGTPFTDHYVILRGETDAADRAQYTTDGTFRFVQLPDETFSVRVQTWSTPPGTSAPVLHGVRADTGPLRLVADFPAPVEIEPARARVRFVDAAERVRGRVGLWVEALDEHSAWAGEEAGEHWTFEIDEPGRYRVAAYDGERLVASGEVFEVAGGEDLDLGVLTTDAGATLVLRFARSAEHPPHDLRGLLAVDGARRKQPLEPGLVEELRLEGLQPGPATLSLIGDDVVSCELQFVLVEGVESVVDVPLEPAARVPYRLAWEAAPPGERVTLRFVDTRTGEVVDDVANLDLQRVPNPIEWTARLPLGAYRLEADFSTLPDRSVAFVVSSLGPDPAPTVVLE